MHYYLLCADGKILREAVQSDSFSMVTFTCISYSAYSNDLKESRERCLTRADSRNYI